MKANAVVRATEVDHSPLFCNTLPEDGSLVNLIHPEVKDKPRQVWNPIFGLTERCILDPFCIIRSMGTFTMMDVMPYVMGQDVSVDIDNEMDFMMGEFMFIREQ